MSKDGSKRTLQRRNTCTLYAFAGALLFTPSLLIAYAAWLQSTIEGEMFLHVQGWPWLASIWVALCICAAPILRPLTFMRKWWSASCGAVLAPVLGAVGVMLYKVL